jgi:O-methyltransferase/aklanonic acid methyltransferase
MASFGDDDTGSAQDDATTQKRLTAALYDSVAPIFDRVGPTVFARFGEQVVVLADIRPGSVVLDVATGRGANLFPAARAVGPAGRVVGIDFAEGMVDQTRQEIARLGLNHAIVLPMDAEALTFPDASFDAVLCSFAYFFFPHLEHALTGFYRVLRPGGVLGLTAWAQGDERWRWYEDQLVATFECAGLPFPAQLGGGHRDLDELKELLSTTGFREVRRVPLEVEAIYTDAEEWWAAKWTHGTRRPLEAMPESLRAAFIQDVTARMAPLRQPDGYHELWRVNCLLATKPEAVSEE